MSLTIDLPPEFTRHVHELAKSRGIDEATVVADFTAKGLTDGVFQHQPVQPDSVSHIVINPISGLPTISVGHPVSYVDVAAFLAEENCCDSCLMPMP